MSANAGYDQSLLAATPAVSKAAKQEGYNVDLLDEAHSTRASPAMRSGEFDTGRPNNTKLEYTSLPPQGRYTTSSEQRVPFWRTRAGIIGLAILAIVVVGAVVGGAVGGTVGKGNKNAGVAGVQQAQPAGGKPAPSDNSTSSNSNIGSSTSSGSDGSSSTTSNIGGIGQQPVSPGPTPTPSNPDSSKAAVTPRRLR